MRCSGHDFIFVIGSGRSPTIFKARLEPIAGEKLQIALLRRAFSRCNSARYQDRCQGMAFSRQTVARA